MDIELIDYTKNGIKKIARLSRATRKINIDPLNIHQNKKDDKFIESLIKVQHLGILEHVNFTFHISEISRALTHQLVRHRIGFSFLQMSNRHAKPNITDYVTPPSLNKIEKYDEALVQMYSIYDYLIREKNIPIEDARYILPPAFFTHISFSCNARSLRNFLELRLVKGAQWEIRDMACKLFDIVYSIYPLLFEDLKPLRDRE